MHKLSHLDHGVKRVRYKVLTAYGCFFFFLRKKMCLATRFCETRGGLVRLFLFSSLAQVYFSTRIYHSHLQTFHICNHISIHSSLFFFRCGGHFLIKGFVVVATMASLN